MPEPRLAPRPQRLVLLLAAIAVVVLAGCGRYGPLEPPPTAAEAAAGADSKQNLNLHRPSQTIERPKKDFALDPLLQ